MAVLDGMGQGLSVCEAHRQAARGNGVRLVPSCSRSQLQAFRLLYDLLSFYSLLRFCSGKKELRVQGTAYTSTELRPSRPSLHLQTGAADTRSVLPVTGTIPDAHRKS